VKTLMRYSLSDESRAYHAQAKKEIFPGKSYKRSRHFTYIIVVIGEYTA